MILEIGLKKEERELLDSYANDEHKLLYKDDYESAVNDLRIDYKDVRLVLVDADTFLSVGSIRDFMVGEEGAVIPLPVLCIDHQEEKSERDYEKELQVNANGAYGYFCLPVQIKSMVCRINTIVHVSEGLNKAHENAATQNLEYKAILANYAGGVTVAHNDAGHISYLYKNNEFYTIFGYTEEQYNEEVANRIYKLVAPDYIDYVKDKIRHTIIDNEAEQFDCMAVKRDGSLIWINIRNTICSIKEIGKQVYLTIFTDVTHEREKEERVRTINKELTGWEIFVFLDVTRRKVREYYSAYASPEFLDKLLNKEHYYEQYIISAVYEDDSLLIYDALSYNGIMNHFKSGEVKYSVEYRRYTPSGEILWFEVTVVLMQDKTNSHITAFLYSRNIDLQMKSRIARNHIVNMDVEDITIINIARKTCNVVNVDRNSTVNSGEAIFIDNVIKYVSKEVILEDRKECMQFFTIPHMLEEIQRNGYAEHSFWLLNENGHNRRMSAKVTYLDETQKDLLMIGRDITDLFEKEQEEQILLQQAVEMANLANEEKSRFLSRMSHDMRTPLNAIIGLSELAQQENDPEKLTEYHKGIANSSRYLLGLINDLLDLSKIESGNMELHEEPYPLEDFILSINTVIKPLMDDKNIEFVMNLKDQVSNVKVDRMRFTQIFFNLLSNAAKYTPSGGRVEFTSEEIPARDGHFGMRFRIADTGIGMSKEFLNVIFSPFTQENRPETRERKGSGLGLAIVKEVIELVGGNISVESELNKGTTFTVDLYAEALWERKANQTTEEMYDRDKLDNLHILLVDDNEINSTIFSRLLIAKGCKVDVEDNGLKALEKFKNSAEGYYNLILTDIKMPIMDGLEASRKIRALNRSDAKTIPIVAATADAYSDIMTKILNAGMNARVVKPVNPEELYRIITLLV